MPHSACARLGLRSHFSVCSGRSERLAWGMRARAGFLYPFRHPKTKGAVEGLLYGLGSMLRSVGVALDDIGAMVQGPAGAYKDHGTSCHASVGICCNCRSRWHSVTLWACPSFVCANVFRELSGLAPHRFRNEVISTVCFLQLNPTLLGRQRSSRTGQPHQRAHPFP